MGCAMMENSSGESLIVSAGGGDPFAVKTQVEVFNINQNKWDDGTPIPAKDTELQAISYKDNSKAVFLSEGNYGFYVYDPDLKTWTQVETASSGWKSALIQYQF